MSYELSNEKDFESVLKALSNELDADNVGVVHDFSQRLPEEYNLSDPDMDYLSDRGLEGLENLASTASYFMELRKEDQSQFTYFTQCYPGLPDDLANVLTPVNQGFTVNQASSTLAEAGFAASHLVGAGLAEKNAVKRTYRMTEKIEDYRMVEDVVENIQKNF